MSIVVSDTSPLRALHHLKLQSLLSLLFQEVYVPPAVVEVLQNPRSGLPTLSLEMFPALRIQAPSESTRLADLHLLLDPGEAEALALAVEVHADAVLMDESEGRRIAAQLGVASLGVLGVLLKAKAAGHTGDLKPLLTKLQKGLGFFISDVVSREVFRLAGESP